ncbi:MAG TPA: outer membrane beta-barrel protein [Thermoanaerobaculia bacterium]|nr:outer membrane beta-barrel protein [Thermoanaerobaculia bacterium]
MPLFALSLLFAAAPLAAQNAQNWSVGVSTGPFVFGKFVERTTAIGTETGTSRTTTQLTANTRPGLSADIERSFSDRWAARLEGTFTDAKLTVKNKNGSGVSLDAGKMNVTTWAVPIVFNFNRHGAFRVHIFGGPAYVDYDVHNRSGSNVGFSGSRGRFGGVAGAGLQWWFTDDFAAEGNVQDIVTASPFERSDFPAGTTGLTIAKPHNVHTTVGLRYRF